MSVYSNEVIARRFYGRFSIPTLSLSQEAKAVLAAIFVWAILLGVVAMHDTDYSVDTHSNTNVEDLRGELPIASENAGARQHY